MQADWARWTFASVMVAFREVASDDGHAFMIEGVDNRTDSILQSPIWVEARMTGPWVQRQQARHRLRVEANVLISSNGGTAPYELNRVAGLYQERLLQPIPVWNYGDQLGDFVEGDPETQLFLGCLTVRPGRQQDVTVFHFGRINPNDGVRQSVVDAALEMFLGD
jgi:hypothetical protein